MIVRVSRSGSRRIASPESFTGGRGPRGPRGSKRPSNLLGREGLDDVAHLDTPNALDADAALEALQHLAHVVLEALQRRHGALAEHGLAAPDPDTSAANDLAL